MVVSLWPHADVTLALNTLPPFVHVDGIIRSTPPVALTVRSIALEERRQFVAAAKPSGDLYGGGCSLLICWGTASASG